ncbi:MAG: hypothetical protein KC563_03120 [Nitrospira sp.]|nr:hypothetical protein [Nitrospira sp.]MCA9464545.1 hypothetical protein [Nitrospira sp.]MCA9474788.1 hypothetical protein [Nitrospira sp.]MCA9478966.1 hypothetical protein [Nitrospira sp.]MCB9710483.1 hypothetical protein [Nitrospiraceae bacterium]
MYEYLLRAGYAISIWARTRLTAERLLVQGAE